MLCDGFWGRTSFKEALIWGAAISIFVFILVLQMPEPLEIAVKIFIIISFFSTLFMYALKNILWFIVSRISLKNPSICTLRLLEMITFRSYSRKKEIAKGEFIDAALVITNNKEW